MAESSSSQDHPGVRIPPPLIFFVMAVAAGVADRLLPLSIGIGTMALYVGGAVVLIAILSIMYIARIFQKLETEIEPWKTTSRIIKSGPYRISRNPVYMLASGVPVGVGLAIDTYWGLIFGVIALWVVYHTAVKKEEKYLAEKFGQEYLEYKARVRRWL